VRMVSECMVITSVKMVVESSLPKLSVET